MPSSKPRTCVLGALVAGILVAPLALTQLAPHAGAVPQAPTTEVVLLENDGVLPHAPSASLAVITAGTVAPTTVPGLAEALPVAPAPEPHALVGRTVVDLGPVVPAALGDLPPIPAEVLTAPDGAEGLAVEYFGEEDLGGRPVEAREPWAVRTGADDAVAVRWSGVLTAPEDGRYELAVAATGRSRLVVDGVVTEADATAPAAPRDAADEVVDADPPTVVRTDTVTLDLAAGQQVPVVVEHVDAGKEALAALVWASPVAPPAVTAAVDAAAQADVAVIHVPSVPITADEVEEAHHVHGAPGDEGVGSAQDAPDDESADPPARPGRLPVDHEDLIRRVAAANPRTVVVLDAAADPSLEAWLPDSAAVLHVPSGRAAPELIAEVLRGELHPHGVLDAPLVTTDPDDAEEEPAELFPEGFGLTYPGVTEGTPTPTPAVETAAEADPEETSGEETTTDPTTPAEGETPASTGVADPGEAEATTPPQPTARTTTPGDQSRRGRIPVTGRIPDHARTGLYVTVGAGSAVLGDAQFLGDGWQLTGELPEITVVDTRTHRSADAGWTVSARMSDLEGAATALPAASVGWTPHAATGITPGPAVVPALGGGPGLAEPAVLGSAAGEARRGPAKLGADLVLRTGYDTAPGSYAGTLTVTIFPAEED